MIQWSTYGDATTADGKSLNSLFDVEWLWKFNNQEVGGKFNIWNCPINFSRSRWDRLFVDAGWRIDYQITIFTSRMFRKALRTRKNLERMRYYYG